MIAALKRFEETLRTGKLAARRLTPAGLGMLRDHWPEAAQIAATSKAVHPDAQAAFLDTWMRVGDHIIRQQVANDDLFFAALRKLLPRYEGAPMILYRGEHGHPHQSPLGTSWTRSYHIAERFALHGTAVSRVHPPRRAPGEAIVFRATVSSDEIICAPCLHGQHEGEYVIDPRAVKASVTHRVKASKS